MNRPRRPSERLSLLPGIAVACRPVLTGDEAGLTAEEDSSLAGCAVTVRRHAGAARLAARELLAERGWPHWPMPRSHGQPPDWPTGLCGSLSHCASHAAAALASRYAWLSVGIDVESAEPIDPDVLGIVATSDELRVVASDLLLGKVLFCAKEAAYKAIFALDRLFLEPRQVVVDLNSLTAVTPSRKRATLAVSIDQRIVVVAAVRALTSQ